MGILTSRGSSANGWTSEATASARAEVLTPRRHWQAKRKRRGEGAVREEDEAELWTHEDSPLGERSSEEYALPSGQ
jgi:hypothetical protein